jgi:hypothetical protein
MNQRAVFLNAVCEDRSDLARVLQKHKGLRRTVEDLYPDNAHFIYELLQNAEDKGATTAWFTLTDDRLIFEHNGESFSEEDIWGITDIGEGTKATDKEKIGCFGIGFKSVFAYTDSPEIYSPTFCFRIDQLVLPSELPNNPPIGGRTRFELPFNSTKKSPFDAHKEIQTKLDELSEVTLLFLSCIQEIHWGSTTVHRIQHSEIHLEVRKELSRNVADSSHFLRFSDLVPGLTKQCVSLAFPLHFVKDGISFNPKKTLSQQMQIVAAQPGIVAVSFPCAKEASGLRFHIHAPFVPELSRASVKETAANEPLFTQLAKLASTTLHTIRDLNLLTPDFLGILPNSSESLPARYYGIRQAIIRSMNHERLTPTFNKGHAPATQLFQSKASLKSLLNKDDICFILNLDSDKSREWAVGGSQKNSLQDHFLTSLSITYWGFEHFIQFLRRRAVCDSVCSPGESFLKWLNDMSDEWMQVLYATLYAEYEPSGEFDQFSSLAIVRRSDGTIGVGSESFFPSEGVQQDAVLPRVKESVYSSGKSIKQQKSAKAFLEQIGVKEVGEAEEIEAILKLRYGDTLDPQKSDLKRFIALVESDPKSATLFSEYLIFQCADGDWAMPSDIYLDLPFIDTGLKAFYDTADDTPQRFPLASEYSMLGIATKSIAKFAEAVGAQIRLLPTEISCDMNPFWGYLSMVPGTRYTYSGIDRDYTIDGLYERLKEPSIAVARLIWRTMCDLPNNRDYFFAYYQLNDANGARQAKSQLVHALSSSAWVPQQGGTFVRPQDAAAELLLDGFAFDSGDAWLKEVEFGDSVDKSKEERCQQQVTALKLGVTIEDIEFIKNNPVDFKQFKRELEKNEAHKLAIEQSDSPNRERRRFKLRERREIAPVRASVKRLRSVPNHPRSEIDRESLFTFYYDDDDEVTFCQMCLEPMPFIKRNGDESGECVWLFRQDWAEVAGLELKVLTSLKLVLCPVCSAVYVDYVHSDIEKQKTLFEHLTTGNSEKFVVCDRDIRRDRKSCVLHFHQTHLEDIKDCLG